MAAKRPAAEGPGVDVDEAVTANYSDALAGFSSANRGTCFH
jgi:hypothetical protein